MKTLIRILFLCFVFCFFNTALCFGQQSPGIEWQKTIGGSDYDDARSIVQTSDGGFIVAGATRSNNGMISGNNGISNFLVVKLDSAGIIQWQKCYGGSYFEYARSVQQTIDGGYIVSGTEASIDLDVIGNHGLEDAWVIKLDSVGIIQWQKCLGGSGYDYGHYLVPASDGGYAGVATSTSSDGDVTGHHGNSDYWVFKLDSVSLLQWQKSLGGTDNEDAYAIQQTFDGGYIVAGSSNSTNGDVIGNHGGLDCWIVKLTSLGFIQWKKSLGGTSHELAFGMNQTSDAGCIIAGATMSNDGNVSGNHGMYDAWIVKLDLFGNIQWQKCLGGSNSDYANSIQQTIDGGYIVAGYTLSNDSDVTGNHGNEDYWIVKLDPIGNIQWQKCLGGTSNDRASCIQQTNDSGYIISGFSESNNGNVTVNYGIWDYWIVKLYPDSVTGINNLQFTNYDLKVFPNPAKDEITIIGYVFQNNQTAVLKIYNVMGKEVFSQSSINRTSQIVNLKSFNNGVYFLQLQTGAKVSRVKFIKQ